MLARVLIRYAEASPVSGYYSLHCPLFRDVYAHCQVTAFVRCKTKGYNTIVYDLDDSNNT
jgi:hypothetical protein